MPNSDFRVTIHMAASLDGLFDQLDQDIALRLAGCKTYQSGTVELRYEVRDSRLAPILPSPAS